ncbi:hypothetical protein AAMO2058_000531800 [Amorphochlora amoebiformis]
MLISPGLVNSVDYDVDGIEGDEIFMPEVGRKTTVTSMLEHSPPKKALSILEASHKKATSGEDTSTNPEKNSGIPEIKLEISPESDQDKKLHSKRLSVSGFFEKQKISVKTRHTSKSSLTSLLSEHTPPTRGSASPSAFVAAAATPPRSMQRNGPEISVSIDLEEPPIKIRIGRGTTVDEVIGQVIDLGMLDKNTKWTLLIMDEDGEIEPLPLQGKMRIQPLGNQFFLSNPGNKNKMEDIHSIKPREEKVMDRKSLQEYSEYRVIKTNEKGKRQERILGIDAKWLYNKKPGGGGSVWRKQRSLIEVTAVTRLGQPGCFSIRFANGTAREYECGKTSELEEIVHKITVLRSALS